MTLERTESCKYVGAAPLVRGMALKTTALYKELDIATAGNDTIGGVALQPAVQNDNIGVALPGSGTVKVVAGGAVALGDKIGPRALGKFVASVTNNLLTVTNATNILTSAGLFGVVRVGDTISGPGIPGGTTVLSIQTTSSLTMSAAASDSTSNTRTFLDTVKDYWGIAISAASAADEMVEMDFSPGQK